MAYCPDCERDDLESNDFYSGGSSGQSRLCIECSKKRSKYYYVKAEEKRYEKHLLRKYGISLADYNRMLEAQGGVCAACGKPETAIVRRAGKLKTGCVKRLCVDHNHCKNLNRKPFIRSLLCTRCNQALGYLRDDADLIQKLLNYCRRWDEQQSVVEIIPKYQRQLKRRANYLREWMSREAKEPKIKKKRQRKKQRYIPSSRRLMTEWRTVSTQNRPKQGMNP